ncbi:DEAD/DEAH box helicase family protein [Paraclostridium sordellii]|uniref:DEAD/DEAH box helicase family protein n=1 Tax=Paraclostridium sordellii TaxID=1505 RepID=UPI001C614E96|nr:DEAD/DEAH box helicase family protein [Paeniclostridium sordellii]QYE96682.1 DEAD/DEAH box helicase family protein [Paeniclostridium sordellii]
MEKLWLSEAMLKKAENGEKLEYGVFNIINAHAGSGKTSFIYKELLENTEKYTRRKNYKFNYNLDRCMMVCDTSTLVDSNLLDEEIKDKVKRLDKGELKKALVNYTFEELLENNYKCGKVLVITYSTLGFLLDEEGCKNIIKCFDLIVFDEIHNLFLYSKKYDKKSGYNYQRVISNINSMLKSKTLIVALTATPINIEHHLGEKNNIPYRSMFNKEDLKGIRCYEEDEKFYIYNTKNIIKQYILKKDEIFGKGEKLFIYTNRIEDQADKYKQLFIKNGIKAEWLCSKNNGKMNDYQIKLRSQLLEGNKDMQRGIIPDDLDVLIVNAAYETGWNLYDDRIQYIIVDDTKDYTQIQARNRVRHNIKELYVKGVYDELQYPEGTYNRWQRTGKYNKPEPINDYFYNPEYIRIFMQGKNIKNFLYEPNLIKYIDKKYLNIPLKPEIKEEIAEIYGIKHIDMNEDPTWKSVSRDIELYCEHIVHKTKNNLTWIFKATDVTEYMKNNNIEKCTYEVLEKYRKSLNKKEKKAKIKSLSNKKQELEDLKIKIKKLKEEGKSIREMASILNVSKSKVGRYAKE